MNSFAFCERETLRHEGGYVDDPRDPGGATYQGVTQETYDAARARAGLDKQPVRRMSDVERLNIYRAQYWTPIRGDDLSPGLDLCVYDYAVNSGPGRAAKALQAALGGLVVDGHIGELTLQTAMIAAQGKIAVVIEHLCARRIAFMKQARTKDGGSAWAAFGKGWSRRVAAIYLVACRRAAVKPDGNFALGTFGRDAVDYAWRWMRRYHDATALAAAPPDPSPDIVTAESRPDLGKAKALPPSTEQRASTDKFVAQGGALAAAIAALVGAIDSPWALAALAVVVVAVAILVWRLWPRATMPELTT